MRYRHNTWKNIADIDQTMPFEFCGLNMTWFGASFNGSSVMCYLPEAVDMALHVAGNAVYDENGKLVNSRQGDLPGKRYSSLTPIWRASRGKLRYTRRMSVKLTENGYELITTQRNDTICEFAKNIKFAILNEDAPDDRSSFLVDDIAVYDYDMMNIRTQDGTIALGVNDNKGKNVYLMPGYLPQTQIGTIIAAIYDQDNKLINTTIADYKPNQKLELFVPDDGNEYSIKYFSWENIGGQIPVNDAIEFK